MKYMIYMEQMIAFGISTKKKKQTQYVLKKDEQFLIIHDQDELELDKIQEHIKTAEKALGFISELTKKDVDPDIKTTPSPRPITNFFKD